MSKRSSNFSVRSATVCSLTSAAALIAVAVATGWSVPALAHDANSFACRASALRAEGVVSVEPFVANDPATPCADDHAALIGEVTISDVRASALSADTVFVDRGDSDGTVAAAFSLTGSAGVADIVSADILSSEAEVGSVNGQCRVTSRSFVASATVLGQPEASFDVHTGEGTGRYNGVSGATAEWQLTDAGEPGTDDSASLKVWDRNGTLVLDVSGNLDRGNHQAH